MERKELDFSVVITQHGNRGSADLYSTMPWCARIPKGPNQPACEGYSYGRKRKCKSKATILHIDVDGSIHCFCTPHLFDNRFSEWHTLNWEDPHLVRTKKWFDKCVEWTDKAKASIDRWNKERGFSD